MYKKKLYIIGIISILIFGFLIFNNDKNKQNEVSTFTDYKNTEYLINGQNIKLINGLSIIETAPDSATKIVTRYFGNEVKHDLNGDGKEDVVFILTQNTGGSGTFYYVVAALWSTHGYTGSQGLLLGDRIAPQTTEMSREVGKENIVVVNYADRAVGESFATPPSIGKSIWLKLDTNTMQFGEVVQNFEGEADTGVMNLQMKKWILVSATNNGKIVTPKKVQSFTITFDKNSRFSATTDCNGVGGEYSFTPNEILFSKMMSTLMYCEGSEEKIFSETLINSQNFHFTSKGELIIEDKQNSNQLIFR